MYTRKKQRADILSEIETLLFDLEKRLQFAAVPIRDWLLEIVNSARFPRLVFLEKMLFLLDKEDLETAWQTALKETRILSKDDIAALCVLGTHLGKSDVQTQLKSIEETAVSISFNKKKAIEKAETSGKVYVGLGVCVGMATALLLV